MILQAEKGIFPNKNSQILFLIGLSIFTAGQILIKLGQPFVESQQPIDFAHWLLYIGVLFLLPFAVRLPFKNIHVLTIPALVLGISFVIGMCVLDFIFWSLPNNELERQLAEHLINTHSIWGPFVTIGSSYIFVVGLVLPSLSYWSTSKSGPTLIVFSTLLLATLSQWWTVLAFFLITLGYARSFGLLHKNHSTF